MILRGCLTDTQHINVWMMRRTQTMLDLCRHSPRVRGSCWAFPLSAPVTHSSSAHFQYFAFLSSHQACHRSLNLCHFIKSAPVCAMLDFPEPVIPWLTTGKSYQPSASQPQVLPGHHLTDFFSRRLSGSDLSACPDEVFCHRAVNFVPDRDIHARPSPDPLLFAYICIETTPVLNVRFCFGPVNMITFHIESKKEAAIYEIKTNTCNRGAVSSVQRSSHFPSSKK